MIPGTRAWVVRSLRDWSLEAKQGTALATYRSGAARESVIQELNAEFSKHGLTTASLRAADFDARGFVLEIVRSKVDVLHVLDPDQLIFGDTDGIAAFWVNFQREALAGFAGAQIWWMLPDAAIRFGSALPDLRRFFLFREALLEEPERSQGEPMALDLGESTINPGGRERGEDFLRRALATASRANADTVRIWFELGIPAIAAFSDSGLWSLAQDALLKITNVAGTPEDAITQAGSGANAQFPVASAHYVLAGLYPRLSPRRLADSIRHAKGAVEAYRALDARAHGGFLPALAMALDVLMQSLSAAGQADEALGPAEEAVRIYRELTSHRPDDTVRSGLAAALNRLAMCFRDLGRHEEALARETEATAVLRELAARRPERFLRPLAMALNNLGNILGDSGHRERALRHEEEAVAIYRQLASKDSGEPDPDLALALSNLGNSFFDNGRSEEALAPVTEAVHIYRELAAARPDEFQADLARCLALLGWVQTAASAAAAVDNFVGAIKTITPLFRRFPQVYGKLYVRICMGYLRAAQAAGISPDPALLEPTPPPPPAAN